MSRFCCVIGLLLLLFMTPRLRAADESFPRQAVQITVRLANTKSTATGFVLTRSDGNQVLVTAAHVFERAEGETISVFFRQQEDDGTWKKVPTPLKIRNAKDKLWQQHEKQDVAVIAITIPDGCSVPAVSVDVLATEDDIAALDPGDLVRSVCYPHAAVFEPSQAAFPLVRLGCIASYPLAAKDDEARFLVDCNTFEGDSGSLIYWKSAAEVPTYKILGVVHGQHFFNQRFEHTYESGEFRKQLGLAIITHATAVREVLAKLP